MPAKSKAQARLMQAVAHNPEFAKKVGISQKVGREFAAAEGGEVPTENIFKRYENRQREAIDAQTAGKSSESNPMVPRTLSRGDAPSAAERAKSEAGLAAVLKKRGFAGGGSIDGCASRGKTRAQRR